VGCLPLYPEEYNVAAVAVSSWKWLMGPFGAGLLYTSAEFRDKIEVTMVGSASMQQGLEYLDHTWNPHVDGRKFEYSTLSWEHLAALNGLLDAVFLTLLHGRYSDGSFTPPGCFSPVPRSRSLCALAFSRCASVRNSGDYSENECSETGGKCWATGNSSNSAFRIYTNSSSFLSW